MFDYLISKPILLASRSPRRQELLRQVGIPFQLIDVEIDETVNADELPLDYVVRMAKRKAITAWQSEQVQNLTDRVQRLLLSADTCVVLDQTILGKPDHPEHAKQMLQQLSGRSHMVITAICLIGEQGLKSDQSSTRVEFAKLSLAQIEDYCASAEGVDKAGGYAIQGAAATFIQRIEGSYSGVVGLPLFETARLIREYPNHINVKPL